MLKLELKLRLRETPLKEISTLLYRPYKSSSRFYSLQISMRICKQYRRY